MTTRQAKRLQAELLTEYRKRVIAPLVKSGTINRCAVPVFEAGFQDGMAFVLRELHEQGESR
jgi:hypothetical protein